MSASPSVVTADVSPLPELGWYKRLRSLAYECEDSPPEPETSLKILIQEADRAGIKLTQDVAHRIIVQNQEECVDVRLLVGSLRQMEARRRLALLRVSQGSLTSLSP